MVHEHVPDCTFELGALLDNALWETEPGHPDPADVLNEEKE